LDGKLVVDELAVSQDLRWSIIGRLNRFAYPAAPK
jgi:aminopeptidase N